MEEAIRAFLERYKLTGKLSEVDLRQSWETLMGPSIARHTTGVELKGKVLVIKLDSSVLRHELGFARDKIVEKVNEHFGRNVIDGVLLA